MEILEWLQKCVRCSYISDLRYGVNNIFAKNALKDIDVSRYTLSEISDAIGYIYGTDVELNTIADVKAFFGAEQ